MKIKIKEDKNTINKSETKLISEATKNSCDMELEKSLQEDKEKEKKEFFIVYENVKKGIINLEDLMIDDLVKVKICI